jgi:dolichol kinase
MAIASLNAHAVGDSTASIIPVATGNSAKVTLRGK